LSVELSYSGHHSSDQHIKLVAHHPNLLEMMGGGPDTPSKESSDKMELVLCALPWPESRTKKAIDALKEEFNDVEVKYFETKHDNGKQEPTNIPEREY
jgi:hypothetical protein